MNRLEKTLLFIAMVIMGSPFVAILLGPIFESMEPSWSLLVTLFLFHPLGWLLAFILCVRDLINRPYIESTWKVTWICSFVVLLVLSLSIIAFGLYYLYHGWKPRTIESQYVPPKLKTQF